VSFPTHGKPKRSSKLKEKMTGKMNTERLTKAISNKAFSGNSNIVARSNIRVGGQVTTPQSLTAFSLNRYMKY